ncbi:hypothetical protein C8R42DRAFT_577671 [Lentinula raphanica]|nr:hypothetical protein C8R42DRAFT_577671 [Lentinula raphanica]
MIQFLRLGNCTPWCTFGCNELESVHHLFVHCPMFQNIQSESSLNIVTKTNAILSTNLILTNANLWPLGLTKFYLGLIPPSRELNPSKTVEAA